MEKRGVSLLMINILTGMSGIFLLLINIFISLSVLFFLIYLMNKIGQRLKALETYRLINLLEYMNDELPISQNSYLFLTESHDVYFYLDNMVFDISKVYRLRNKKYFSFDKKWERKIINGIIQKMKEIDENAKAERQEKIKNLKPINKLNN